MLRVWMAYVVGLSILGGCATRTGGPGEAPLPGFQVFPSARAFDAPGQIFRVEPDGQIRRVIALTVTPRKGEEVIPSLRRQSELSLSQFLETIGVPATSFPASARVELLRKRDFTVQSVNGTRMYLEDSQIDRVLTEALKTVALRRNSRYFLIRETVVTDNLAYSSKKNWLTAAGIEAEFQQILRGKTGFKWGSSEEFLMDQKFDRPLHVWYTADLLKIETPLGAGAGQLNVAREKGVLIDATFTGDIPVDP